MNKAFDVVFEDEHLIVLNKKAKIPIYPVKNQEVNLTSILNRELSQKNERAWPCHRLDRQTSGLVIYAKRKATQTRMMNQFRLRKVKKYYLAFVRGRVHKNQGVLESKIIDREAAQFGEKKKKAVTKYRVIERFNDFTYLEVEPFTGRTNQIRIQFAHLGNPLLGERKYALGRDFSVSFRRLALHAFRLSFLHPMTGKRLGLEIAMPSDMKTFLQVHTA